MLTKGQRFIKQDDNKKESCGTSKINQILFQQMLPGVYTCSDPVRGCLLKLHSGATEHHSIIALQYSIITIHSQLGWLVQPGSPVAKDC